MKKPKRTKGLIKHLVEKEAEHKGQEIKFSLICRK